MLDIISIIYFEESSWAIIIYSTFSFVIKVVRFVSINKSPSVKRLFIIDNFSFKFSFSQLIWFYSLSIYSHWLFNFLKFYLEFFISFTTFIYFIYILSSLHFQWWNRYKNLILALSVVEVVEVEVCRWVVGGYNLNFCRMGILFKINQWFILDICLLKIISHSNSKILGIKLSKFHQNVHL